MRVLVTGAAGSIGRVVTVGLADRGHDIVGLDRVPEPEGFDGPWHSVDCADPDAVAAVFAESALDAVVHLAGHPGEADLPVLVHLPRGHHGSAARRDGRARRDPHRLRVVQPRRRADPAPRPGLRRRPAPAGHLLRRRKDGGRGLLSLYADRYAIDAVACRIGSFRDQPGSVRALSTWLSHDDCVRMVDAALTATAPGFAVLYGISANTRAWWDLEPGRRLGYEPQDDAEEFAGSIEPGPDDEDEAAYVGGPFALEEYHRPALDRT